MRVKISWRGWKMWPLLWIGPHRFHLCSGIAFGVKFGCGDWVFYLGYGILSIKTEYNSHFIEMVGNRTWPKKRIRILKYAR